MSKSQRTKGAAGERELSKLLASGLGIDCHRNLDQVRDGGADLLGVGPWSIEVKRHERLAIGVWWRQACEQADGAYPALAYRQSRRPWSIIVPLSVLVGRDCTDFMDDYQVSLYLDGFLYITKQMMGVFDEC